MEEALQQHLARDGLPVELPLLRQEFESGRPHEEVQLLGILEGPG